MKKLLCIVLTIVIFTMPLTVLAEQSSAVDVKGTLQNTTDTYDIEVDSVAVEWYVTNISYPNVWNASETNPVDPYQIINNSKGSELKVTLTNFIGDTTADSIANDLILKLTGYLADDGIGTQNLANGFNNTSAYTKTLKYGTPWKYGFTGSYSGSLSKTAIYPKYAMTLEFSFL